MIEQLIAQEMEAATLFRFMTFAIFVCAIAHTFMANSFVKLSDHIVRRHLQSSPESPVSFWAEIFRFLGEVEAIFALWAIPLFLSLIFFTDWQSAVEYFNTRKYVEPMFVVVVMAIASTYPIVDLMERILKQVARCFGGSLGCWWATLLIIGPILGSLITEAAAMTLTAVLLGEKFYSLHPPKRFAYATLGLLFTNISLGGLLTNFASPPVFIISRAWNWDIAFMITTFGWKVLLGLVLTTTTYYLFFRKDLRQMESQFQEELRLKMEEKPRLIPLWVSLAHIFFLAWCVFNAHAPALFIGSFLLFLGFYQATIPHQHPLHLRRPLMVGMFLAGLVIHGGLQSWWIDPLLRNVGFDAMMFVAFALTPFNDNAAITYLASQIPNLTPMIQYAIVAAVVAGGGLTVIANAPNPAGQMILKKHFYNRISPLYLFLGALIPSLIFYCIFYLFR